MHMHNSGTHNGRFSLVVLRVSYRRHTLYISEKERVGIGGLEDNKKNYSLCS